MWLIVLGLLVYGKSVTLCGGGGVLGFGCWTQRLRASMSAATEKITVCSILRSSISAYVSVGLPPGQGLRAKGFQFHAYFYMLFILDSVCSNGFELRRGNASKAKWNEFP